MSGYIAGAVWNTKLPERSMKMVLVSIADNANDEGFAWPSVETIGERCMFSKRAVLGALKNLEEGGWLRRVDHPSSPRMNAYQLNLDKLQFERPKAGARSGRGIGAKSAPVIGADSAPIAEGKVQISTPIGAENSTAQVQKTTRIGAENDFLYRKNRHEPSGEPSLELSGESVCALTARTEPIREELLIVYRSYPRREGEIAALTAIRKAVALLVRGGDRPAMPLADALSFLRGKAERFARSSAGQQGRFTPMPEKWFNDGRYLDDESAWAAQEPATTNRQPQSKTAGNAAVMQRAFERIDAQNHPDAFDSAYGMPVREPCRLASSSRSGGMGPEIQRAVSGDAEALLETLLAAPNRQQVRSREVH